MAIFSHCRAFDACPGGGQTVRANDRNGGTLRLNASRYDDDDDEFDSYDRLQKLRFIGYAVLLMSVV